MLFHEADGDVLYPFDETLVALSDTACFVDPIIVVLVCGHRVLIVLFGQSACEPEGEAVAEIHDELTGLVNPVGICAEVEVL